MKTPGIVKTMSASQVSPAEESGSSNRSDKTQKNPGQVRLSKSLAAFVVAAAVLGSAAGLAAHEVSNKSGRSEAISAAELREDIRQSGSGVVVGASTFNYQTIDSDIESLQTLATGEYLEELNARANDLKEEITKSKAVLTAKVNDAAVTAVDAEAETGTVVTVFTVTSVLDGEDSVTVRQVARVELQRIDGQWLATGFIPLGSPVRVGKSSASVAMLGDEEAETTSGAGSPETKAASTASASATTTPVTR